MKPLGGILTLVAIVALLMLIFGGVYVVDETKQVVITRFGKPIGDPITEPGIHFKLPMVHQANFFEKRFLEWDGDRNQVPTKDKRFIWVDTYARWKIADALLFYQRLTDESRAQSRLDDIIDGATRDAVASHDLVELVRTSNREIQVDPDLAEDLGSELSRISKGRSMIVQEILESAATTAASLGIDVIDMRFKRIDYNDDVRQNVYERMIAERTRIAQRFRSEGQGESARIRGEKERDLKQISSEAYRQAQEMIGKADAEAAAIYAEAYNRDPDFYQFLKTMETYPQVLDNESWLILSTDGELLRFLNDARGR